MARLGNAEETPVRRTRGELIDELVADLTPSRGPRRLETLAAAWWLATWAAVLAAILATGPLREGWTQQLLAHPRFLLEMGLGAVAGAAAILAAFRLGVPGPGRAPARLAAPLALLAAWAAVHALGLAVPALDPSARGARPGCWMQVLAFAMPPLLLGLILLRRLAPLERAWTGAVVGAAAGAVPGLLMQVACMYAPGHILAFHLGPILVLAALGAALGALLLRRI